MSTLSDLFVEFESKKTEHLAAKKVVEEAYRAKSDVVKAIFEANSRKKQIVYKGKTLTICKRGESYFFRGDNDDITKVEDLAND